MRIQLSGSDSSRHYLIVAAWILVGICCLPIDLDLARLMLNGFTPGDIRALFHRGEVFGHAYGALGILITIYVLDPSRRRAIVHVGACFLAAGLSADVIKLQFWRIRPRSFVELGMSGSTFAGTLWSGKRADWAMIFDHSYQSFPSAHTAGAVALAYSLGQLYPAGRTWFYVLAALCGMNRIDGGAHYASDVCWGVALGYLVATRLPSAPRLWTWLEARSKRPPISNDATRPFSKAA